MIKKMVKKIEKKVAKKIEKKITKTEDKTKKVSKPVISEEVKTKKNNEEQKMLITKEGMKKVQEELEHLKTVKRHDIAQKLQEAISYGDLSENAEYSEAKDEQAFVEAKIIELEQILEKAQVVSATHTSEGIELGEKVYLQNLTHDKKEEYIIVGSTEADPLHGKISNESPVGKALLGMMQGDKVKVSTPRGVLEYKIMKIE